MLWPQAMAGVVGCARHPTPRAGRCHVKASQAFTPSLSKEGRFLSASFTHVPLYSSRGKLLSSDPSFRITSHESRTTSAVNA
jgi:hypothetical protein